MRTCCPMPMTDSDLNLQKGQNTGNRRNTWSDYLLLYTAFLIFSLSAIMNKLAARYPFLSLGFLLFYGLSLAILMLYALLWQRVLKRFHLTVAYANRAIVTLLGVLWGVLLFQERLTWNMIAGAGIILAGIRIVVTEDDT